MYPVLNTGIARCSGSSSQFVSKKDSLKDENYGNINNSTNVLKYPHNFNFPSSNITFKSAISLGAEHLRKNEQAELFKELQNKLSNNNSESVLNYIKMIQMHVDNKALGKLENDQKSLILEMICHDNVDIADSAVKLVESLLKSKQNIKFTEPLQIKFFEQLENKLNEFNKKTKTPLKRDQTDSVSKYITVALTCVKKNHSIFTKFTDKQKELLWKMINHNDDNIAGLTRDVVRTGLDHELLECKDFSEATVNSILYSLNCRNTFRRTTTLLLMGSFIMKDIKIKKEDFNRILTSLYDDRIAVRNCAVSTFGKAVNKGKIGTISKKTFNQIVKDLNPNNYYSNNDVQVMNIVTTIKELSDKNMIKEGYIEPEHLTLFKETLNKAKNTSLQDNMESIFSNLVKNNILTKSDDKYSITGIMQYT